FHGNIFKYGTYVGPMAALCGAYWFGGKGILKKLLAGVIVGGAVLSSATIGAVASIVAGLMVTAVVIKNTTARLGIILFIGLAVVLLFLLPAKNDGLSIAKDFKLTEADGENVRQRYIEWQAELNMLEKRAGAGTAAGAINDYRSEFYYRLVKLNTLKAFDLNGWLACGAEIGVVGLMCLGWVFYSYGKKSWAIVVNGSDEVRRLAGANLAALTAAAVANVFGCLMYNGIIIVFVLILAMMGSVEKLWRRENEI
ncbi:MAG: O-antigen ligase family protein, partial [Planctomycetes bacterium]|nr:O-antigen ligase family protein [Planctomycetota bacterium]